MNHAPMNGHQQLHHTFLQYKDTKFWSIYLNLTNFRTTSLAGPFQPDGIPDTERCSYLSTPHSSLEEAMAYRDFHIKSKKAKGYEEVPTMKVEEDIVKIDFNNIIYDEKLGKRSNSIENISDYSAEDSFDEGAILNPPRNGVQSFSGLRPEFELRKAEDNEENNGHQILNRNFEESKVESPSEEVDEELLKFPLGQPIREIKAQKLSVEKLRSTNVKGLYMTPYVGGVRCLWSGFEVFLDSSKQYVPPAEFRKLLPGGPIEGEFIIGKNSSKGIKEILKHKNMDEWKELKFIAYDAPEVKASFEERVKKLRKVLKKKNNPYVVLQEPILCQGLDHLNEEITKQLKAGNKGVVLRQSQGNITQFLRKATKVLKEDEKPLSQNI